MNIFSADKSKLLYSRGKTGTSTLEDLLKNNFDWNVIPDGQSKYFLEVEQMLYKEKNLPEITFIIRNPRKRYKSGIRELLWGPHIYDAQPMTDKEFFESLARHKTTEKRFFLSDDHAYSKAFWENSVSFLMGITNGDFSFNNNYHVSNWLHEVLFAIILGYDVNLVKTEDLDNFCKERFKETPTRKNVKDQKINDIFDEIFGDAKLKCFLGLEKYLETELAIYRFLRDDFADLDIVDRKETALELLYRDMESNFGVNFNPNHALGKANFNRKVINYRLQKLLSR